MRATIRDEMTHACRKAHRFAAPQPAKLREPPRTGHGRASTSCVYEFLQAAVHRCLQINLLLHRAWEHIKSLPGTPGRSMLYKMLHRELLIYSHELHLCVNSSNLCVSELAICVPISGAAPFWRAIRSAKHL